jgi:hypothetical protein
MFTCAGATAPSDCVRDVVGRQRVDPGVDGGGRSASRRSAPARTPPSRPSPARPRPADAALDSSSRQVSRSAASACLARRSRRPLRTPSGRRSSRSGRLARARRRRGSSACSGADVPRTLTSYGPRHVSASASGSGARSKGAPAFATSRSLRDSVGEVLHRARVGHVEGLRADPGVLRAERAEPVEAPRRGHHRPALRREQAGGRGADAAAGTRDDRRPLHGGEVCPARRCCSGAGQSARCREGGRR